MKVLGLDIETTGLDPNNDSVTEIGAVLYDVESCTPLEMMNRVIKTTDKIPDRIVRLTGITDEIVQNHGKDMLEVISEFNSLSSQADYLVIHNAPFDLGFLKSLEPVGIQGLDKPVIDTMRDLPIDDAVHQSVKLTHLCATHGFLNPFSHRAIFDVLSMLKVLSCYNFNGVIAYKNSPTIRVIANVSFEEKDKAKNAGFRWNGSKKYWFKEMKQHEFDGNLDFPYDVEEL